VVFVVVSVRVSVWTSVIVWVVEEMSVVVVEVVSIAVSMVVETDVSVAISVVVVGSIVVSNDVSVVNWVVVCESVSVISVVKVEVSKSVSVLQRLVGSNKGCPRCERVDNCESACPNFSVRRCKDICGCDRFRDSVCHCGRFRSTIEPPCTKFPIIVFSQEIDHVVVRLDLTYIYIVSLHILHEDCAMIHIALRKWCCSRDSREDSQKSARRNHHHVTP
jgi:hypothetical protein